MSDQKIRFGREVLIPGHEKTITPLQKIAAAYRAASFDSSGKYNFDQSRQDTAITAIMSISQFYSKSDALQMLGRAVSSASRPTSPSKKPPHSAPKTP
jgi:hypothetical protein